MARLVGVDLPRDKRIEVALTYIYGIGRTRSQQLRAGPADPVDVGECDLDALVARKVDSHEACHGWPFRFTVVWS